uniref:Putative secreted protein n=1 Tax=Ixodes ricinus TaxID=34613 RepID=A0A6B0UWH4_IXORI
MAAPYRRPVILSVSTLGSSLVAPIGGSRGVLMRLAVLTVSVCICRYWACAEWRFGTDVATWLPLTRGNLFCPAVATKVRGTCIATDSRRYFSTASEPLSQISSGGLVISAFPPASRVVRLVAFPNDFGKDVSLLWLTLSFVKAGILPSASGMSFRRL